jgi:hypothetical protein
MKYILIILTLASVPGLQSQAAPDKSRTCRILLLEPTRGTPKEAFLFDGKQSQKVSLSNKHFSNVIELPRGELNIAITPTACSTAEDLPPGSPSTSIPAEIEDIYLVITNDPENTVLPIRLHPIQINDTLKTGETLWSNLTIFRICANLGEESIVIAPMDQAISRPPLAKSGYYEAKFSYQLSDDENMKPIMTKSWWFDATSRNLGFIVDTQGRLPKIFTVRDKR